MLSAATFAQAQKLSSGMHREVEDVDVVERQLGVVFTFVVAPQKYWLMEYGKQRLRLAWVIMLADEGATSCETPKSLRGEQGEGDYSTQAGSRGRRWSS